LPLSFRACRDLQAPSLDSKRASSKLSPLDLPPLPLVLPVLIWLVNKQGSVLFVSRSGGPGRTSEDMGVGKIWAEALLRLREDLQERPLACFIRIPSRGFGEGGIP